MKKDFVMPILVLSLICLIMSGALAAVRSITQPVIEAAAVERADVAMREIIPEADEFVLLESKAAELPKSVIEIYGTGNNTGYIFTVVSNSGYGGEIKLICGIDPDGKIMKITVLEHSETKGLGTNVFNKAGDYEGKDKNLEGIDAIAGATITSNAYKNAILDAFSAFELVNVNVTEEVEEQ